MHHSAHMVEVALDADEARQRAIPRKTPRPVVGMVALDLEAGDSAWNPASTKRDIDGPGRVIYRRYPDGGIDVERQALRVHDAGGSWHSVGRAVDMNAPEVTR